MQFQDVEEVWCLSLIYTHIKLAELRESKHLSGFFSVSSKKCM